MAIETAASTTIEDLLAQALEGAGGAQFHGPFTTAVEMAGAAQCIVFCYAPTGAHCLLAQDHRTKTMAQPLAQRYLEGWFEQDPLYPLCLALRPGESQMIGLDQISGRMDQTYRRIFFEEPGLNGKTAIVTRRGSLRLAVNLYGISDQGPVARYARLIAAVAATHFSAHLPSRALEPLFALSPRERQVCLGILAGQKTETIAHQIGVSTETCITYRRRAYHKLGIHSRSALFALCVPQTAH